MLSELVAIPVPNRLGGHPALDFVNTKHYNGSDWDFLVSYPHLIAWNFALGLLDEQEVESLAELAEAYPLEAEASFKSALALRALLYPIFAAISLKEVPSQAEIGQLNTALQATLAYRHLTWTEQGIAWGWNSQNKPEYLQRALWGIILESADLLASAQSQQMRQCPNCGWLFVDTSRNQKRRWCSMELCGSQVKSRRQYERGLQAKDEAGE